jgi:hypothetical protein
LIDAKAMNHRALVLAEARSYNALGGATVNYASIDHFQEVAQAHFVVRRLERLYGKDTVRAAYERLSGEAATAA